MWNWCKLQDCIVCCVAKAVCCQICFLDSREKLIVYFPVQILQKNSQPFEWILDPWVLLGGSKLFYHIMYGIEMRKVCFNILTVVTPKASENLAIDGRKMGEKLWKVYQKFAKGIPRNSTTDFNIVISLYEMQKVCS